MSDDITRRYWVKVVGAASAAGLVPAGALAEPTGAIAPPGLPPPLAPAPALLADGEIVALMNTSDVFIPPRGGGRMRRTRSAISEGLR